MVSAIGELCRSSPPQASRSSERAESFGDPGAQQPQCAQRRRAIERRPASSLVTVEGGGLAYSAGMTNYELAVALVRLGARTAMGLGSGTSAAMAFDGTLLTRATEQPIADALMLRRTVSMRRHPRPRPSRRTATASTTCSPCQTSSCARRR